MPRPPTNYPYRPVVLGSGLQDHENAANPHPTYLTEAEANALYAVLVHSHTIANVTGLQTALDGKQATLVSGTNIKSVNGNSLLGSGDLVIGSTPVHIVPDSLRPSVRFGPATATNQSNLVVVANRLYFIPCIIPYDITATRISFRIATTATGNARMGIYNVAADRGPGTLILDTGNIDTSTGTLKEATINQALSAGMYYLAIVFSGTPTCNLLSGTTNMSPRQAASSTSTGVLGYYRNYTFAALPANETGASLVIMTSAVPVVLIG